MLDKTKTTLDPRNAYSIEEQLIKAFYAHGGKDESSGKSYSLQLLEFSTRALKDSGFLSLPSRVKPRMKVYALLVERDAETLSIESLTESLESLDFTGCTFAGPEKRTETFPSSPANPARQEKKASVRALRIRPLVSKPAFRAAYKEAVQAGCKTRTAISSYLNEHGYRTALGNFFTPDRLSAASLAQGLSILTMRLEIENDLRGVRSAAA